MRKSFSASTSTCSTKNYSRYLLLLLVTSWLLLHPEQKNARCLIQARLAWENEVSRCGNYFTSHCVDLTDARD